jgi:hypothetical protein
MSTTLKGQSKSPASALRIRRDQQAPGGYRIDYLSIRNVPTGATVYWSLLPPPPAKSQKRLIIELAKERFGREVVTTLDVTTPLTKNGEVYLKSHGIYDSARLLVGKRKIISAERPWL